MVSILIMKKIPAYSLVLGYLMVIGYMAVIESEDPIIPPEEVLFEVSTTTPPEVIPVDPATLKLYQVWWREAYNMPFCNKDFECNKNWYLKTITDCRTKEVCGNAHPHSMESPIQPRKGEYLTQQWDYFYATDIETAKALIKRDYAGTIAGAELIEVPRPNDLTSRKILIPAGQIK